MWSDDSYLDLDLDAPARPEDASGRGGAGAGPRGGSPPAVPVGGQPFGRGRVLPGDGYPSSFDPMFEMSDKRRRACSRGERMKRPSSLDAGFERYVARQLHAIYDPVLDEAIPDGIARVLEQFGRKSAADEDGAASRREPDDPAGGRGAGGSSEKD